MHEHNMHMTFNHPISSHFLKAAWKTLHLNFTLPVESKLVTLMKGPS